MQSIALGRGPRPRARQPNRLSRYQPDPGTEARTVLHHLLEHGDLAGRDAIGRTLITLAVDDRLLERLLTFEAGSEDLEDGGDGEPDDHDKSVVSPC